MAELQVLQRLMNPWALHLQKLGLELKCPLCLNLFNKPVLLPCNHMFCNCCIPREAQFRSECAACKHQYDYRETRPAPHMENIVSIYRSLDAIFNATAFQPFVSEQSPLFAVPTGNDRVKKEPSVLLSEEVADGRNVILPKANDYNAALLDASDNDHIGSTKESEKVAVLSWKGDESNFVLEKDEIEMNLVPELSPESPPSFANSSDPGSRNCSVGKYSAKRSSEHHIDTAEGETAQRLPKDVACVKRQKSLNYTSSEAVVASNAHGQEKVSSLDNIAISQCSLGPKNEDLAVTQSRILSESSDFNRGNCAFCHSSKITEGTGTMIYYSNGKEIQGNYSMFSNVIPVHSKCIEWTPQVFYEGEAIKNLESELGRAAKLKCSSCGKKGAALGCFAKSCRRTYHVPCAFEIQECRWDCEDFLMLCPKHNSFKFPSEKSKSGKSTSGMKNPVSMDSSKITTTESKFWTPSSCGPQEWVFCGSALSSEEKYLVVKFADKCGATVSKFWRPNVTHVIAATDENGACTRTLKVLMAILSGRWILTMDWIKACIEANCPVNEEPYEVSLDNHGCHDGPKTGRLRISRNAPKLFDGLKFYFSGDFLPAYKVDLLDLVRTAGGTIIQSMEDLMQSHDVLATSTALLVVYNHDPPRGCAMGAESSVVSQRLAEAQHVASVTNSLVIRHTWILESIAGSKLLPFVC